MKEVPIEVLEAMAVLGKAWPNWKVDDATVQVWWEALGDLAPADIRRAAMHFVRTSEYPPTIAAIRKLIRVGDQISADEAWEKCRKGERPPNESAARALKAIGNPFARGTHAGPTAKASEMATLHAHFRDAYNAYQAKEEWHAEEEAIDTLEAFSRAELLEMDREEMRQIEAGDL